MGLRRHDGIRLTNGYQCSAIFIEENCKREVRPAAGHFSGLQELCAEWYAHQPGIDDHDSRPRKNN
jgi:hypothetical protein